MSKTTNNTKTYYDQCFSSLQKLIDITHEQFKLLVPLLEIRRFEKRKLILAEGDIENYVNMVMEGMIRKFVNTKKGEVTLQLATEGHLVQSEISFHTRHASEVALDTMEPTILISLSHERLHEAFEKIPGTEELGRSIVTQMFIKKDNRYFNQLKLNTRERFLEYMQTHPHMLQRVPQKILASYLNIKPETFSRLKHLIKRS